MERNNFYTDIFLLFCNWHLLGLSSSGTLTTLTSHWSESDWWGTVFAGLAGTIPHNFRVNGTRDAVEQLGIQFGKSINFINTGIWNVSHSCSFHNISDDKLLDCFVFRHAASTIRTTNVLHVTTPFLATTIVSPFGSHLAGLKTKRVVIVTSCCITTPTKKLLDLYTAEIYTNIVKISYK